LNVIVSVVVPPLPSSTVMVAVYTPPFVWLASGVIVPEITPVFGSIERPGGRSVALKVSVSPSTSLNDPATGTEMVSPSSTSSGGIGVESGLSFTGSTVTVTIAVEVPPSPSLIV